MRIANPFHNLLRIFCYLLLALICCGQVYHSVHLHHFHPNDSVAFEINVHPSDLEVAHTSTHHHHGENSSHEGDTEHKYTKKTDWNVRRSNPLTKINFDVPCLPLFAYTLPPVDFDRLKAFSLALPCKQEPHASSLTIRGPPQLA